MANLLVSELPVVLEDVVVLCSSGLGDFLEHGLHLVSTCTASRSGINQSSLNQCSRKREMRTRISVRESSGISISFSPWCFGITSCERGRLAPSEMRSGAREGKGRKGHKGFVEKAHCVTS